MAQKPSRFLNPAEIDNVRGIELDSSDVDKFMTMLRAGLIEAAADHQHAVQDNFALRADTTIRLSRPVRNADGEVVDHAGESVLEGTIRGRKLYFDDSKAPKVD